MDISQSNDERGGKERAEEKRAMVRERKARSRVHQPKEKCDEARRAMARKRKSASDPETATMRTKSRTDILIDALRIFIDRSTHLPSAPPSSLLFSTCPLSSPSNVCQSEMMVISQSNDEREGKERAEEKKAKARERKARNRANQSKEKQKRDEERATAWRAAARKRLFLSDSEKATIGTKSRTDFLIDALRISNNEMEGKERAEEKKAKARERKARSRANQPKEKRDEDRAKARRAMASKRKSASDSEKVAMRAQSRTLMRRARKNLTEEERAVRRKRECARRAKIREVQEREPARREEVATNDI